MASNRATRGGADSAAHAGGGGNEGGHSVGILSKLGKRIINAVRSAALPATPQATAESAAPAAAGHHGGDNNKTDEYLSKMVKLIEGFDNKKRQWVSEKRGWLTVLATLAVSIAYQAGLNPPGGFWQDDGNGAHTAGAPVRLLRGKSRRRYLTFYYLNSTTLLTSLFIVVLLANKSSNLHGLVFASMVDIMSLVSAYIAGSAVDTESFIVLIVGACFVFCCIVYSALNYLLGLIILYIPCLGPLAMRFYVPPDQTESEQAAVPQQPADATSQC